MSIKDLFGKKSYQILSVEKFQETVERNGESIEYLEQRNQEKNTFIPRNIINFNNPSTFARYGSAEKYYLDSINRIIDTYPYDGSLAEKTSWHNNSTYIDEYIFDNLYPRTTGFIKLNQNNNIFNYNDGYRILNSPQFVFVKGGPNSTPNNPTGELRREYPEGFGNSNIWNPSQNREVNLYANANIGNTVEFWFKLDEDRQAIDGNLCLFDLWNNQQYGSPDYSRFLVEIPEDKNSINSIFRVSYVTSGYGKEFCNIGDRNNLPSSYSIGEWNHYAFSVVNSQNSLCFRLYINGKLIEELFDGTKINKSFTDDIESYHLTATIGSLQHRTSNNTQSNLYGYGSPKASFDEFRFWKSIRNSEEIGRNWLTQVYGGTNTDNSNVELGVYFKFNEGITDNQNISALDKQVLDYSGRISNGIIINYDLSVRDTGSAINEKKVKNVEFKDPIMYRENKEVISLIQSKREEGLSYDQINNASILNSIPSWIAEADETNGSLSNLTQMISSYFDTLHLQIEALPTLGNIYYSNNNGDKPLPFVSKMLESLGLSTPDIFIDASILERLLNRDEDTFYEEKLYNVKNLIYQNIYNNIIAIYKSKGTEKSFRNLFRCFGIGDDIIKINLYGNEIKYKFEDNNRSTSIRKNFLDFNDADRYDSTVYQAKQPDNEHSVSYILGSSDQEKNLDFIPFTFEASIIFPKKIPIEHPKYDDIYFGFTDAKPSCLFGMHQAKEQEDDYTWYENAHLGFRVVAIKEEEYSNNAKFRLDIRGMGFEPNTEFQYTNGVLETDYFSDVYDDTRWNFAVRIRVDNNPNLAYLSENSAKYFLEFYGINTVLELTQKEFHLEYELEPSIAKLALNANKRIFLGSEYRNFNDNSISPITFSDVKVGEVRYWQSYLSNDIIKYHAQDPDNWGVKNPYKNAYFYQISADIRVPEMDTLCLYWDFATVTKSSPSNGIDEAGNILSDSYFYIDDVSGGSLVESTENSRYGWLSEILKKQYTGKGDFYYPDDLNVVDRNYLISYKQNLPEIIGPSETINIASEDDEYFTKLSRPVNYFWALEKSMYQNISQEIIEAFASITEFNNLLGEPVNRYRMEYKNLNKLRQLFFQRFIESPKIERYINFYKWIDSSIGDIIKQLIPASANFSDDIRTVIESHILERNKYWNKFPTLEFKQKPPEAALLGINELTYNWKHGHATEQENENCLWWKSRAERDGEELTSGNDDVDQSKNKILDSINTKSFGSHIKRNLSYEISGERRTYDGQTFVIRSLTTPYKFNIEPQNNLHSGINNRRSKKIDFVRAEIADNNTVSFIEAEDKANSVCVDRRDVENPFLHSRLNLALEGDGMNGSILSLFELNKVFDTNEKYWNSNHSDTYGDDKEIPLQGIFTKTHVGGLQSRHVPLNDGEDNEDNRPEAWNFSNGTYTPLLPEQPKAQYYRDEKAKRPINIRNIKHGFGNYRFDYQVVQTSGRRINNRWLIEKEGENIQEAPTSNSETVLGLYDFKLPVRARNEHIFTERFSAPGSSDTLSRGMLDVEAEELAVYNGLNYRNLDVRILLKNWLTYHTKKWGFRSYHRGIPLEDCENPGDLNSSCRANYHKNHRNNSYRPEIIDDIETCKVSRDNAFVSHQIPRSDFQYSWINSSVQKTFIEEINGNIITRDLCPWGYVSEFPNITAKYPSIETDPSELTAFSRSVVRRDQMERLITEDGLPFLNNFYKIEGARHPSTYNNIDYNMDLSSETFTAPPIMGENGEEIPFNDVLNQRNGPYQFPSWKQIRGSENPIVIKQRKHNIISNLDLPKNLDIEDGNNRISIKESRAQTTTHYLEPVVAWNKPIHSRVGYPTSESLMNEGGWRLPETIISSYSNNVENFANPLLVRRLGLQKDIRQIYDVLTEKYLISGNITDPYQLRIFETIYEENIFPKHRNVGLDRTRRRKFYKEDKGYHGYDARASEIRTFWGSEDARERTSWNPDKPSDSVSLNAFGWPLRRSSVWALEYKPRNEENIDLRGELSWPGDSQYNGYTYEYRTNESNNIAEFDIESENSWLSPRPTMQFIYNPRSILAKEKSWLWKAAEISNNSPWYSSYEEYSEDTRAIGKDYSLTPEFNISTHIDFYINQNSGNFRTENKNFLELKGAIKENDASGKRHHDYKEMSYLSWDGVSKLDISEINAQPNNALNWNELFNAKYNTVLANQITSIVSEDKMFILEEPVSIDSELSNNWNCREPYPVIQLNSEDKINLSIGLNELITNLSDNTQIQGIKVGLSKAFNWNWSSPPDTSEIMLERWNNSFMLSSWINLQNNSKNGIFELKADYFTEVENDNFISLTGDIISIKDEKDKISTLQTQLTNKIADLEKVNNTVSLNSTIANIFEQRRISYSLEIEQLSRRIEEITENIRNVINTGRLLSGQTAKETLASYLYLDEGVYQDGDLIWEDSLGNKLIFAIKSSELKDKWKNICLYYIGGGTSNKPSEYRHRVLLFVDGVWIPSNALNATRMREITGLGEDSIDIFRKDGSLFFKNYFPRTISHISFAKAKDMYLNGKATDLLIFRGNPGLSNITSSHALNNQHNRPDKYAWFFDHKNNGYYSKTGRLFNNLANRIFSSQCQDANELYAEWRDAMTVCKNIEVFENIYYDFESIRIPIIDSDSIPTEQYNNLQDILGNINDYVNGQMRTGFSLPRNNFLPDPSAYLSIPPVFLNHGPFDIVTSEEPESVSENGGEPVIRSSINSACSELIGWFKLGIPRKREDVCDKYVWNEEFFKSYAHTDTIPHLTKVINDHEVVDNKKVFRLEVDAVKKLIPYNGFYPSQHAVQIGSIFYDSVMPFIKGEEENKSTSRARTEQAALQPFFAPGILFNTFKSGIAVDWASYTGTTGNEAKEQIYGFVKNSVKITSSITESFTGYEGTIAQNILNRVVTDDIYRQVSLGNISTPRELEEYARQSMLRSAADFRDELRTYTTEFDSIQEINRFANSPYISSLLREDLLLGISGQTLSNIVNNILDYIDRVVVDFRISNLTNINIENNDAQRLFDAEGGVLNTIPTLRLPFESLISLDTYLPKINDREDSKLFLLAPSYYQENYKNSSLSVRSNERYPYFEWTGEQKPLYEMAMHNFLAEIPNFFLKNNSLTNFKSAPQSQWKHVEEGWTYYLDIHLYKTNDFEMIMSPHNGKDVIIGVDNNDLPLTTHGRYFGPSMRYLPEDADQNLNHLSISDPSQAAYVPPYFYGRAKARLKFKAPRTGQPTIGEILLNLEIDYINEEMEQLFSSRTSGQPLTASQLYLAAIGEVPYKWHDTPAYQARMPIQASINFDRFVEENDDFVWSISPKFESPALNFKTEQNLSYLNKDNQCGTGMWGGYGEIPTSEQGLFLAIEESPVCSSEQINDYSVLIGIPHDTREANRNIITLKDPTGRIDYIKIGQPSNAIESVGGRVNFYSWQDKYMNSSIAEILSADNSSEFIPYSADACIRTIGTSPRATLENISVGMSGEYDIEAYLQADRYASNIDELALPATSNVPTSSDLANAIVYHIKMSRTRDRSYPWDARIVWVSSLEGEQIRGLSRERLSEEQDNIEYSRLETNAKVIVEIIYDHERNFLNNRRGRQEVERIIARISPKITLESKTDSLMNPTGKLGIYYIDSQKNIDLSSDDREVEIQRDREFYSRRNLNACDDKIGSLIDVCGFTSQKSRIGEIADSKEISEALVMIPFVDRPISGTNLANTISNSGRNFFKLSRTLLNAAQQGNAGSSVIELVERIGKYNLPPQFDFMRTQDIEPFVMYMFEFTDNFDSQDLANIWQGLMPKRAKIASKDNQFIEHELDENNFFEGKQLPNNIRWLVFRVKRKANNDYYDMINGTNINKNKYNYNWPYDFCSLVELCKIKGGISIKPNMTLEMNNQGGNQ